MKTTVTITLHGIDLDIEGYYTAGQDATRKEPPMASEFEIENIKASDPTADLFELLDSSTTINDIAHKACEAVESIEP